MRRGWLRVSTRDEQGRKHCSKGKHWLPESEFHTANSRPDKLHPWCKGCVSEDSKIRRSSVTPERLAERSRQERARHLERSYGLTEAEYWDIWYRQGGACAICGSGQPGGNGAAHLHVDHCHSTGKIRGLLCYRCNVTLGKMHDSSDLLRMAADYLEGWFPLSS